jgi:hypothetical protein
MKEHTTIFSRGLVSGLIGIESAKPEASSCRLPLIPPRTSDNSIRTLPITDAQARLVKSSTEDARLASGLGVSLDSEQITYARPPPLPCLLIRSMT